MKIGHPNPKVLADDLFSSGYLSCAHAEALGCFVTEDPATRFEVDFELLLLMCSPIDSMTEEQLSALEQMTCFGEAFKRQIDIRIVIRRQALSRKSG